ncbi:MAG TPA: hypothetical protein VGE35_00445 [Candidatus Paceibacterota bacterium]
MRNIVIAIAIVAAFIAGEIVYLKSGPSYGGLDKLASKIISDCADAPYKPTCYEEEIPRLMNRISMEDAFKVTRFVQSMDRTYQYCHVLGHKIAAAETATDPARWQTVIQRCPSGVCSNGCIHGAFQERFRKESLTDDEILKLKPQLSSVCEKKSGFNPTGLEQGSCYHALGHLLMYITEADVPKSLALCNEFSKKPTHDYSHVCYDGVFMQIYQPLEPDDFSLIEGKEVSREEVSAFCGAFTGEEAGSCYSESWPLFYEDLRKPTNLLKFCAKPEGEKEQRRCFDTLMYVMAAQFAFNNEKIFAYCEAMPTDFHKATCMAQAANRMIETDYSNGELATAVCERAEAYDKDHICFNDLLKYSTFNFHKGSEPWKAFCNAMPEPWMARCLSR